MQRRLLWIVTLGIGLSLGGAPALGQVGTWSFPMEKDPFRSGCLPDLRRLNEKEAGQSGWMYLRDGNLYIPARDRPEWHKVKFASFQRFQFTNDLSVGVGVEVRYPEFPTDPVSVVN